MGFYQGVLRVHIEEGAHMSTASSRRKFHSLLRHYSHDFLRNSVKHVNDINERVITMRGCSSACALRKEVRIRRKSNLSKEKSVIKPLERI